MPIAHIHNNENGLVMRGTPTSQQLTMGLLQSGAEVSACEPGFMGDITPAFWGDRRTSNYVLEMDDTGESAKVHVVDRIPGQRKGIAFTNERGELLFEPIRTIHIPEHTRVLAIGRTATLGGQEVGGILLHLPDEGMDYLLRTYK
jgi:hypothetical protein